MTRPVKLDGYGTTATLAGGTLTVSATTAMGKGALGATERAIAVADITALTFTDANALRNGAITLQSPVGKTVLHFRRKQAADARALHAALREQTGPASGAPVTAPLSNEARDARAQRAAERAERVHAELRERQAKSAATHARLRAEFEQARAQRTQASRALWADLTGTRSSASDIAELAAFLDSIEAPDPLDGGDEHAAGNDDPFQDGPDTQQAPADRSVAELVEAALDEAEAAALAGDVAQEEQRIRWARTVARTRGGRADRKAVDADIEHRTGAGTLRRGAAHLGTVLSEGGFERWARTAGAVTGTRGERRIDVWSDRIVTASAAYPITAHTGAQVYLDGQVLLTQRPTLTRMALFSPLPGSALIPGLAFQKKETRDGRRAEFLIRDANWALTAALHPDRLSTPRQLAEQVNATAAGLGARHGPTGSPDLLTQLERLAFLMGKGVLSFDEVEAVKAAVLRQDGQAG